MNDEGGPHADGATRPAPFAALQEDALAYDRDYLKRRYMEECARAHDADDDDARSAHRRLAELFNRQIRIMREGRPPNFVV